MAFTYGFYNSVNHDRRYNALQMSQIFDGILNDGVYMSIGNRFAVRSTDTKNSEGINLILIDTGRAWLDHTWNYNDSELLYPILSSDLLMDRIDALVIDVHGNEAYRENQIMWVKGTASSSNPKKPTLIKEVGHNQFPIAYIKRRANAEEVLESDIENVVGTSECPFVTGILETMNIDDLIKQWKAQWDEFFEQESSSIVGTSDLWKEQWYEWFIEYTNQNTAQFSKWMEDAENRMQQFIDSLQIILNDDVAASLAATSSFRMI